LGSFPGDEVCSRVLDCGHELGVRRGVDRRDTEEGGINVLACAAGMHLVAHVMGHSIEAWKACLRVNLDGVFVCSRNAVQQLLKKKSGAIVNIVLGNAVRTATGMAARCASKPGVTFLLRTLASKLAPYGRWVNAIVTPHLDTPGISDQVGDARNGRAECLLVIRHLTRREMATAACFLDLERNCRASRPIPAQGVEETSGSATAKRRMEAICSPTCARQSRLREAAASHNTIF
jgi:NAD(P)-dependent dehydrogenase (short-subunit alcohol dehydrogenase family)